MPGRDEVESCADAAESLLLGAAVACLGGAGALPFDSDRCSEERALIVVGPGEGSGSVRCAGLLDLLLSAWARLAVDDESDSGSWAVFSSTPAMLHLGGFVGLQGGST
jgi:hypothetical protein